MKRSVLLLLWLGLSRFDVRGEAEGLHTARQAPIGNWVDSATDSCSGDIRPKENAAKFLALTPLLTDSSGSTVGHRYLGLFQEKLEDGPHAKVLGHVRPRFSDEEEALSRKLRFFSPSDGNENPKRLETYTGEDCLDELLRNALVRALYQPNDKERRSAYENRRSTVSLDAHLGGPSRTKVEIKPLKMILTKPKEQDPMSQTPLNDSVKLNCNKSRVFGDLESADSEKPGKNRWPSSGNRKKNNNGPLPEPQIGFTRNRVRPGHNESWTTLGVTLGSAPGTSSVDDRPKPGGAIVSSTPSHNVSSTSALDRNTEVANTTTSALDRNTEVASTPTSTQTHITAATSAKSQIFFRFGLERAHAKHSFPYFDLSTTSRCTTCKMN